MNALTLRGYGTGPTPAWHHHASPVPAPPRLVHASLGRTSPTTKGPRCCNPRPVPIYEYRCVNGHTFEVIQKMLDEPVAICESCGAPVERVFHPIAVHFKGPGFYATDYGAKGAKAGAEAGESKPDSKSESKSESKSDAKPGGESKSDAGSKAPAGTD
jgi:putative FmdB family regulatory protein